LFRRSFDPLDLNALKMIFEDYAGLAGLSAATEDRSGSPG
jgi:hypothetical protein